MRLFLAIELPDEVKRRLAERSTADSRSLPKARWVRAETLHLTLVFLGDVDAGVVSAVDDALIPVFARHAAMSAQLGSAGAFPARGKARVLWADFRADGDLAGLHAEAEQALAGLVVDGEPLYQPEPRPFHPHVTLARCRTPWPRDAVERWAASFGDPALDPALDWRVEQGTLFESALTADGPRYGAVSTYPLGAERPAT